ncbi:MAG TPA: hypothetical protein VLH94_03360 [Spirochaetia bacterium]|nr:hypothetical protein [Spirochaetia bacterium]
MNQSDYPSISSHGKSIKKCNTIILIALVINALAAILIGVGFYFNIFLLHAIFIPVLITGTMIQQIADGKRNQEWSLIQTKVIEQVLELNLTKLQTSSEETKKS